MHSKRFEIIVLVYLLLVFSVPSTLGIYKNTASSTGLISTSAWNVSLNQNGINGSLEVITGGQNATYTLNVVSDSEVDTVYSIIVRNIPSGVQVKLDNGSFQPESSTVTFSNLGPIYYTGQEETRTHTLYFKANNGAATVNNQTVTIDVDFKQDI